MNAELTWSRLACPLFLIMWLACVAAATPTVSFHRVVPFEFVYNETPPGELGGMQECVVIGCRGEYEPATFAAYTSGGSLPDVSVTADMLQSEEGNHLLADQVDVRVVKVWPQFLADLRYPFPELLVTKDDLSDIHLQWRQEVINGHTYYLRESPTFPASIETTLPEGQLKQFWVTVRIPDNQPTGVYRGNIHLTSDGVSVASLPLTVCVLPVTLQPPQTKTCLYLGLTLGGMAGVVPDSDPRKYACAVPEDEFREALTFLKRSGIEGVMLYDEDYAKLERAFAIAHEVGLQGPIVQWYFPEDEQKALLMAKEIPLSQFNGSYAPFYSPGDEVELLRRVNLASSYGYEPLFYGIDEIPGSLYPVQEEITRQIRDAGGKVVTGRKAGSTAMRDLFDWANYSHVFIPGTTIHYTYAGVPEDRKVSPPHDIETHYWGCHQERPLNNRLLGGFYHYRSGLDGLFPWGGSFIRYNEDAYHETRRNSCLIYPAQNGPVPTLQSEALREGIDDIRYIQTVKALGGDGDDLIDILQPFSYPQVRILTMKAEVFARARLALVQMIANAVSDQMPVGMSAELDTLIERERLVTTRLHFPPSGWVSFQRGESYVPQYNFAVEDTYLSAAEPTPQGGGSVSIITPSGERVLVQCRELHRLPEGVEILNAQLRLFHFYLGNSGSLEVSVHRVTSPWRESTATWTHRDSGVTWNTPGGDYEPIPLDTKVVQGTDSVLKFDITDAVRHWYVNPQENHGVLLRAVSGNGEARFTSSQATDWRWKSGFYVPSIRIQYKPVE